MYPINDIAAYTEWTRQYNVLSAAGREVIRGLLLARRGMTERPLFTVVVPTSRDSADDLQRTLASLRTQLYPHWEVIAEAGEASGLFNSALERARGEFILPLPPGSLLSERALYELAAAAEQGGEPDLVFADEDRLDAAGQRCSPHFKTAWDPDLMLARDAVGLPAAIRTSTAKGLGGMRPELGIEMALYDLVLRLGDAVPPSRIQHVPLVLCHRPRSPEAGAEGAEQRREIVRRQLARRGETIEVQPAPLMPDCNRIVWPVPTPAPLASVIVPTRDGGDRLGRCLDGILSRTRYSPFELIIVDNGSEQPATLDILRCAVLDERVRVLPWPRPFNYSEINNAAVEHANGEVIVLLNDDTNVIGEEWLRELVSQAIRPEIGAVGAKLLYPDGRVQHCGMALGPGDVLMHQLRMAGRSDPGPNGELTLARSVSAVTGACMALRKAVYLEAGGMNDIDFKVEFNDVDLCLRLADFGYRTVCTPFAELFHLESVTRGREDTPAKLEVRRRERAAFQRLWEPVVNNDPYHNPNVVFGWDDVRFAAPPRPTRRRSAVPASRAAMDQEPTRVRAVLRDRSIRQVVDARTDAAEARMDAAAARVEQAAAQDRAAAAEAGAAKAGHRYAELFTLHEATLSSTSWQITAPLRCLGNAVAWVRQRLG